MQSKLNLVSRCVDDAWEKLYIFNVATGINVQCSEVSVGIYARIRSNEHRLLGYTQGIHIWDIDERTGCCQGIRAPTPNGNDTIMGLKHIAVSSDL